jgi:hypothetical protein
MVSSSKLLLSTGSLLAIFVGLWFWWQPPTRSTYNERLTMPLPGLNQAMLKELDLRVGDLAYDDPALTLRQGDRVKLHGRAIINYDQAGAPEGAQAQCRFILKCAPVASPESLWNTIGQGKSGAYIGVIDDPDFHKELAARIRANKTGRFNINIPRPGILKGGLIVKPERFPVGDYDTRLYLQVDVVNTETQFVHHVGSGRLTILPPAAE